MITYKITSKSGRSTGRNTLSLVNQNQDHTPITPISLSNPENNHLQKILNKASQKALRLMPVGSKVKFKGTTYEGEVVEIKTDVQDCVWKGQKPFFIKVQFSTGNIKEALLHSSSLVLMRKK